MDRYAMVLLGGGMGALLRYVLATAIMQRVGGKFPLGTFVINVSGSFLIGAVMTSLTERLQAHQNWRLFLVIGFLGGYTTFSTFAYETYQAVREGNQWTAWLNVIGSVVAGYVAVVLGVLAATRR